MTLPASGAISIGNVNTETGVAATTSKGLSWMNGNVKSFTGTYNMSQMYGKAWYQKNNAYFNCTLDNRDSQCNCNNCNCQCWNCAGQCAFQCTNCSQCGSACANCACDSKAWIQNNCNCGQYQNCAYVCYGSFYDCNCACRC